MLYAKIEALASYLPDDILDNEMLSKMVDTNDEWITTRTGIKQRHILRKPNAGSSYLGTQAVKRLLEKTGTAPEEVELLICATSNPDYRFPSTASVIAGGAGLTRAYAYDIQAACAGFLVGLQDATAYIRAGLRKKVIVVGAEMMSSMVNYKDRATCPLFGDGAGAALLTATEERCGVLDSNFHVDPEGLEHLVMLGGGSVHPTTQDTLDKGWHYLYQEGRNVYKNAVMDMYNSTRDLMRANNLTVDDVQWLVPHQANLRIIEAVGQRAGFPDEKVLVNLQHTGNTSAASIPICLDEYSDRIQRGDTLILTAFGAGYTWGSCYVVW